MEEVREDERPELERTRGAALRDLLAGIALLVLGVASGGSALTPSADGVDYAFDALGVAWIAWGALRLFATSRRP